MCCHNPELLAIQRLDTGSLTHPGSILMDSCSLKGHRHCLHD